MNHIQFDTLVDCAEQYISESIVAVLEVEAYTSHYSSVREIAVRPVVAGAPAQNFQVDPASLPPAAWAGYRGVGRTRSRRGNYSQGAFAIKRIHGLPPRINYQVNRSPIIQSVDIPALLRQQLEAITNQDQQQRPAYAIGYKGGVLEKQLLQLAGIPSYNIEKLRRPCPNLRSNRTADRYLVHHCGNHTEADHGVEARYHCASVQANFYADWLLRNQPRSRRTLPELLSTTHYLHGLFLTVDHPEAPACVTELAAFIANCNHPSSRSAVVALRNRDIQMENVPMVVGRRGTPSEEESRSRELEQFDAVFSSTTSIWTTIRSEDLSPPRPSITPALLPAPSGLPPPSGLSPPPPYEERDSHQYENEDNWANPGRQPPQVEVIDISDSTESLPSDSAPSVSLLQTIVDDSIRRDEEQQREGNQQEEEPMIVESESEVGGVRPIASLPPINLFLCPVCNDSFTDPNGCAMHLRSHSATALANLCLRFTRLTEQ